MDNDDAMVGTILSRRDALGLVGRAGLMLIASGGASRLARANGGQDVKAGVHLVASPHLTEGPFFVDERLNRSDITAGRPAQVLSMGSRYCLASRFYTLKGTEYKPLTNVHVDVWHADVAGVYSDESNPMNHENTEHQSWLRGYQATDATGKAHFKTIFPGWYAGRCPHIHFKVRKYSTADKSPPNLRRKSFSVTKTRSHLLFGAVRFTQFA